MGIHCPPPVLPLQRPGKLPAGAIRGTRGAGQPRAVVPAAGTRPVTLEMRENKPGSPTELHSGLPFIPEQKAHKTHSKKLSPSSLPPAPLCPNRARLGRIQRESVPGRAPAPQPREGLSRWGGGAEPQDRALPKHGGQEGEHRQQGHKRQLFPNNPEGGREP